MITPPKTLIKAVLEGSQPISAIEQYLLSNYTIGEIISSFAELLVGMDEHLNRPKISVSQEEYNVIISLFKIRGLKEVNGVIVEETRGRKPKATIEDKQS